MKKIAIIGECMIELSGEPFGEMVQSYGGDTLNTATYLSRTSSTEQIEVNYVTLLGKDKLSEGLIERFKEDNINTELILQDENRQPGIYMVKLDQFGERSFLYWRNLSSARYLLQHQDYHKVIEKLATMDMIYISGISIAILPQQDRFRFINDLKLLSNKGVEIAFDSNYRPSLWESVEETRQVYTALFPLIDLALVTFDDEQALWQDEDSQASVRRLKSFGIKTVVVKRGKVGAFFSDAKNRECTVNTAPVSKVVDTTSAGDSFNAGFLNGYLKNKSLEVCCQQGNQLAGVVIQYKGAIIEKAATEHFINSFK
ncbi:sugar kinase [Seminibacterium arietis]|uniref:Sugar kinase n=1 Tax=Seminibacterium arietis TaxID=1173502 RepID=A0ABW3IBU5_9PAST